jgi:hypothetical protein
LASLKGKAEQESKFPNRDEQANSFRISLRQIPGICASRNLHRKEEYTLRHINVIPRRRLFAFCRIMSGAGMLCVLLGMGTPEVKPDWATGFYLIAAEASTAAALPQPSNSQQVVQYSNRFLQDPDAEPARFLLLGKRPDVPLELAMLPKYTAQGGNGLPELQIELTKDSARALEVLTREHLGQEVAFVVDGEPITIHKIRSVISGGRFVLSRCTDTACQYIYGRLKAEQ